MTYTGANGTTTFQVQLVRFNNPAGLESLGSNLYRETTASGPPELGTPGQNGFGTLNQGYLELSNVKVVEEMVNLILAQRAYEVNSKAVQAADEMMQRGNNLQTLMHSTSGHPTSAVDAPLRPHRPARTSPPVVVQRWRPGSFRRTHVGRRTGHGAGRHPRPSSRCHDQRGGAGAGTSSGNAPCREPTCWSCSPPRCSRNTSRIEANWNCACRNRGEPANVPDEPLTLKILDLPTLGVTPFFIVRFELRTARESLGTWQLPVQARVWRDVWVARSALQRGEFIAEADLARERRDMLSLHEPLAEFAAGDTTLEMAEPVQAGSPLLARSVKLRPVLHRGQIADALVQDGALSITMKVEVLEDGAPGQIIRARNSQSRRDIRGKVLNEQTILVSL